MRSPTTPNLTSSLPLPVIPVMDVKAKAVVRAIGGDRERYAPLQTPLTPGSEPLPVAQALAARVGHRHLYIADLDALGGADPTWAMYRDLLADGFALWLDAGLGDVETARRISRVSERGNSVHSVIAALESLRDFETLRAIVETVGPRRLVFSLDLREGELLTRRPEQRRTPLATVDRALAAGIGRVVVIDVGAVGRAAGPPFTELCRQIRCRAPEIELVAGGGIRGTDDLARLRDCGCDAALVSTWLHGWGSPDSDSVD